MLTVYVKRNDRKYSRIGWSVSKRIGHAPVRNRVRRCLREAYRTNKDRWPKGFDIVCVARPAIKHSSVHVPDSLARLISKAIRRCHDAARR